MFQVLLPVDSDESRALTAAKTVDSLPKASETVQVTILSVEKKVSAPGGNVTSDDWYDEEKYPSSAIRAKEYLDERGIAIVMQRKHADPKEAIIDAAAEINADRIVMSGRKRTPTGKVLFGSVTQSVLLDSSAPVTVIMGD